MMSSYETMIKQGEGIVHISYLVTRGNEKG